MKVMPQLFRSSIALLAILTLVIPLTSLQSAPATIEEQSAANLLNTPVPESTPTATLPESTLEPVLPGTIFPTVAPQPTIVFAGDNFKRIPLDKAVQDGVGRMWLSYVNINDKPSTVVPGTPSAANQLEVVYLAYPSGGTPLKVTTLPATVGQHLYWSPNGRFLAYFVPNGSDAGLYELDLKLGVSLRLFNIENLNPRGILSEPAWSPDGSQLVITLATAYDVDIYAISGEGTNFRNLSASGAFDFWPTWSPDGQFLAFVSDRKQCANWIPNDPQSCYRPDMPAPDGGNLYVIEAISGTIRLVSDEWVTAQPHWISASRLAFTSGKRGNPLGGSALWWADLRGGPAHKISGEDQSAVAMGDAWTRDGRRVVYQEARTETSIVIRDDTGQEIARSADLNFPRVAFSASWSPDGKKLVMGGHNGQCPYGMLMADETFKILVNSPANPGVCDPVWSPDGRYIAFQGILQSASGTDGRSDIFIAEANGYGVRNISGRLGGQIRLIGWIPGS